MKFTVSNSLTPLLVDAAAVVTVFFGLIAFVVSELRAWPEFLGALFGAVLLRSISVALRLLQDLRNIAVVAGKREDAPPAVASTG